VGAPALIPLGRVHQLGPRKGRALGGAAVGVPSQLQAAVTYPFCSGRASRAAPGTRPHAQRQLGVATWRCCSGHARRDAPGTRRRATRSPAAAAWTCCSGRASKAAPGMIAHAHRQLRTATLRCCSGRASKAAPGARQRCLWQKAGGTSSSQSGHGPTSAPIPGTTEAHRKSAAATAEPAVSACCACPDILPELCDPAQKRPWKPNLEPEPNGGASVCLHAAAAPAALDRARVPHLQQPPRGLVLALDA
jgi:hypothetical protein